ncbi:hypothetical protein C9374_010909 [Naegleria lovaniensis]|uniref:Transmembrane protein n=1 Tax=Naegleria lovaniensis TaxID=51637 RepID=A0AA88GGU5_NAELO|nr:uncharacterized protein C9374_010909 [Naegleria lovaniensis]KAG2374339.1 hypothetical protein C9374_010909 [Naegleria lovaniensis]
MAVWRTLPLTVHCNRTQHSLKRLLRIMESSRSRCFSTSFQLRTGASSSPKGEGQNNNTSQQQQPSAASAKSKEDQDLEFIIEQAYIKKKVEQAAMGERVKGVLEQAKAKQRRKAHFIVSFGLIAAVAIILFVIAVHQRKNSGVQTETTRDRKF